MFYYMTHHVSPHVSVCYVLYMNKLNVLIPHVTADSSFYKRGSQMLWSVVYRTEKKGTNVWSKHKEKTHKEDKILKKKEDRKKVPKSSYECNYTTS